MGNSNSNESTKNSTENNDSNSSNEKPMATAPIVRVLKASDIRKLFHMKDAINVQRTAFASLHSGTAACPDRLIIPFDQYNGATLVKPATLAGDFPAVGAKIVSTRPGNASVGLPTVPGFIFLLDPETGFPLCFMDGTLLTALRTAAGSGAATDMLAKEKSKVLAVFGAGAQAREHIEAVCCVRQIEHVIIWNRNQERAEALAEEIRQKDYAKSLDLKVTVTASSEEAVKDADIVVTATNSSTPLFDGKHLKKGAHINAVGSYRPDMQEIDSETIKRASRIFPDNEAFKTGDLLIPIEKGVISKDAITGTFAELAAGAKEGRLSEDDITIFKSEGNSVQDIASAAFVLERAQKHNSGTTISFE